MILYIKNMVCIRCKMAVQAVLQELNIEYLTIELGKVVFSIQLTPQQKSNINERLKYYSLELMYNKKLILVERIKTAIIEKFHASDAEPELKFSAYLSSQRQYDYTYLANIFSEIEGSTIERYYISSKIERVKE